MAGEFLPPVEARLTMDISDLVAKAAEAKAAMSDLNGTFDIKTDGLDAAAAKVEALKTALSNMNVPLKVTTDGLGTAAVKTAALGRAANQARTGWGMLFSLLTKDFQLWGGMFGDTALVGKVAGWHIALDGLLEAAFALTPALIDLGLGLAAMVPAGQDIYNHLKAVNDVNQALGSSIPPLTGKFQDLAQAMAPQTVEAYGGALNLLKSQAGGLTPIVKQVVTGLDDWIARIDLYAKSQSGTNGILQSGIGFLTQFRQVVDNVGVAFGNLVKADPGTAHFLMNIVTGASKVLELITSLPTPLLMTVMALHSIDLWGGLVVTAMKNLAVAFLNVGIGAAKAFEGFAPLMANPLTWVIGGTAAIAYLVYQMNQASASAKAFIASLTAPIGQDSASQAILDINTAIGKLNSQIQFMSSSGGIKQIQASWANLGNTGQSVAADAKVFGTEWTKAFVNLTSGNVLGGLKNLGSAIKDLFVPGAGASVVAANNIKAYQGAIVNLTGQQKNLFGETGNLIKQGFTFTQSLGLMDLAGVKAGDSLALMKQKVDNLITGYENMSVRGGLLANSVNAVTFATEQQNSQIQAITQGWSNFISMVTGGESAFSGFEQQLRGTMAAAGSSADKLTISNGKVNVSTQAAGTSAKGASVSMNGLSSASLQLRSSFAQSITSAGGLMNSLLTMTSAAGLGAKGTQMLGQAGQDLVAQLLPLASGSKAATAELYALAQEAGYHGADSFQALSKWIGNTSNPAKNLDGIVSQLTIDSANLANDVKNLANAVGQNLNQAMAAAILQASGGQKAFDNFATSALKSHGNIDQMKSSAQALAQELITTLGNTQEAHKEFDTFAMALGITDKAKIDALWNSIVSGAQKSANAARTAASQITSAINGIPSSKTITIMYQTSGSTKTAGASLNPGFASGTSGAPPGWAWVGEAGPELVKFNGGERVIPSHVATGFAGGTGMGGDTHVHVYLDSREIYNGVAKQAVQSQRRTGHTGMTRRAQ